MKGAKHILLNLVAQKAGGGQQVAINFLNVIMSERFPEYNFYVVATHGTAISKLLESQDGIGFHLIRNNLVSRVKFDFFDIHNLVDLKNIDVIFSLLGPGVFNSKVPTVAGVAVSNIFYPEVQFWHGGFFFRVKKKIIDSYRLLLFKNANALIFENEDMMVRGKEMFDFQEVVFIRPSISKETDFFVSARVVEQVKIFGEKDFNLLMLTGAHPNKNIGMVVPILTELSQMNENNISIIISIDPESDFGQTISSEANRLGVGERIKFIGQVAPQEVKYLVESVDGLLLISNLESFSNNIIEAWTYQRPLVISDASWSRAICGDAALYVDRHSSLDISTKLVRLKNDRKLRAKIVDEGSTNILKYPSPKGKVKLQLDYINRVLNI